MNIWLCPVKPRSWRIIKKEKVFGVPRQASKTIRDLRTEDLLVFHVLKPINGIVAVCKVASEVYEDGQNIWGKDRYPLRMKIEFIQGLLRDENNPVPLSYFFGKTANNEFQIEPYLKNVWITKVAKEQYERFVNAFRNVEEEKNKSRQYRVRDKSHA